MSKQVYRPPGARGTLSTFKLHDDEPVNTVINNQVRRRDKDFVFFLSILYMFVSLCIYAALQKPRVELGS